MFGSSRSGRDDYEGLFKLYEENSDIVNYLESIVGSKVEINDIKDIVRAFETDIQKMIGKTVLIWNI